MSRNLKPQWASKIKALRDARGDSQQKFAEALGVQQPTVWAWEKGDKKRAPSAEAFFRLGSLAPSPRDKIYFWGLGGLDEQSILQAAESISEARRKPKPGEIVRLPCYRGVDRHLKRIGGYVPLPAEFIPNPGSTICLRAENESSGVINSPRGLLIVDTSSCATSVLSNLVRRLIVLSHAGSGSYPYDAPGGIYVGRLWSQLGAWRLRSGVRLIDRWSLVLLTSNVASRRINLCSESEDLPIDASSLGVPGPAFNAGHLLDFPEERPADRRLIDEARERMFARARLPGGSEVLGEVIGRLSGHVKKHEGQQGA